MIIKKYNELNENFYSYFGMKEPTFEDNIRSYVVEIVREVKHVSEKSFQQYDEIIKQVKDLFKSNTEIKKTINEFKEKGYRKQFIAEHIYENYIKNMV